MFIHGLDRVVLDQNPFDDDFLYEESPEMLRFRTATPSIELLTDWYRSRAEDIESCSRQVPPPLEMCWNSSLFLLFSLAITYCILLLHVLYSLMIIIQLPVRSLSIVVYC